MLAMAVGQLAAMLNVPPPIAGKPCSHIESRRRGTDPAFSTNPLWELSLLAITVGQLAAMLNVPLPSRASLAPTLNLEGGAQILPSPQIPCGS
ncbi:hypothetical protein F7R20_31390 [Pseudomonas brassicacearum subsp. brassicacearum]|nr:hypothetical protein F7R20_31390 [Pseudomonas brassicacearum subsp. brassicacearum]QEO80441.1 hypothetical protein ELZ14_23940 [Pseudomonas brassicacearum]